MKKISKKLKSIRFFDITNLAIVTIIALVSVMPVIFIINNAFKPLSELFKYPPTFFVRNPTWQNFEEFFYATGETTVPFSRYLFNSIFVTVVTVFLVVAISCTAAYAFAKIDFPGRDRIFNIIVLSLMFTPSAVMITKYLIVDKVGLINNYLGHILPQLALPVGVFLLKQFMEQVPDSLSEAARLDGASEFTVFWKIVMPAVLPAVGTVMIISFQNVWNDVTTSQYYMLDDSMKTLPYYIQTLTSSTGTTVARQGASAAAGLLLFLPNFIIFAVMQKSMLKTMVTSGIK
ncbi:carbohydrate ABC transporter permease [uncultured Acetatifactor sp.]|uniref:carbohydrate ABC transporter permease n=1 Tax=uncultured Acetatifactor sp. TaxID=1671927 RepID=UPI0026276FA1|nr:carbohydrate ABC transporter permease [uncultured Acetatifactor sp.]